MSRTFCDLKHSIRLLTVYVTYWCLILAQYRLCLSRIINVEKLQIIAGNHAYIVNNTVHLHAGLQPTYVMKLVFAAPSYCV